MVASLPYASYAKLTGRYVLALADKPADPDKLPDAIAATGTIKLTPQIGAAGVVRFPDALPVGTGIVPDSITLTLNSDGDITLNNDTNVYIAPTDDPEGNPLDWTWKAEFSLLGESGKKLNIASFFFQAPRGVTTNLIAVTPVSTSGGVLTVQGPPGNDPKQIKDFYDIASVDRYWLTGVRSGAAKASVDYADRTNITCDWSATNAGGAVPAAANAQVSGNKLYAQSATGAGGVNIPLGPLAAGEKLHASFLVYFKAGGASPLYWGIDTAASGTAPDATGANMLTIGHATSNVKSQFSGASVSGLAALSTAVQIGVGGAVAVDTTYLATVDSDDLYVSLSMKALGVSNDLMTARIRRSLVTGGGKVIGNLRLSVVDARALGGHAFGPVTIAKSLQKSRTPSPGNILTDGADHKHTIRVPTNGGTEVWRHSLPANHDSRIPVDLVAFAHQTVTGADYTPWYEARIQPLTKDLLDKGFAVTSCLDGAINADRFGNQTSIDNHIAMIKWMRDNYNIGRLFLLSASGGAFPWLNMLARRIGPTPSAMCMIGPGIDLHEILFNGSPTFAPLIRNAYGIAADNSDYDAKTAGYDPMTVAGKDFRGIPTLIMTSNTDTVAPREKHVDPFVEKITPYCPEVVVSTKAGDHLDPSQYDQTVITPFFQKYQTI